MGKPAARLGDPTAHGGVITLGFPMVLIGGMPAARMGDMHVCPMMTPAVPPIPHVGGPITLGSPMVLIGGMPAARMGDMATCVGPPATILMGCPTVLIGEGGSGSASGGGAGGSGAASAVAGATTALTDNVESTTKEEHWIEFEFVDKAGNAISGVPYKFIDTNSKDSSSKIRLDGKIRRDALKEGDCKVQLFRVSNAKWSKDKIDVGDKVKLKSDVEGFNAGTPATFEIYRRDISGADHLIKTIETKTKSDKVEIKWEYINTYDPQRTDIKTGNYSSPIFYFVVIVDNCKAVSNHLAINDVLEISLKDKDGMPAANKDYVITYSNGEIRKGKLDSQGYTKIKNVPPSHWRITFPETDFVNEQEN